MVQHTVAAQLRHSLVAERRESSGHCAQEIGKGYLRRAVAASAQRDWRYMWWNQIGAVLQ